jgi:hypothetical protein
VADLAGPEARHLGAHAALDLVRGGWATRWREHPPLHTWLLYRMFDRRIPAAYRSWAFDDINGFWYPMRSNGFSLVIIFGFQYALVASDPMSSVPSAWHYLVWALVFAVSCLILWPDVGRDRARRKHVSPHYGEPRVEGALVPWDLPRERVTAQSMLTWAIVLLGIAGSASLVTVALAPKLLLRNLKWIKPTRGSGLFWESGPGMSSEFVVGRWVFAMAVLVLAVLFGALGAALARRRLGRLLGERPAQPWRVLRPICAVGKARIVLGMVMIVTLVWLEVSGRLVLGPGVLLGLVALLLLPGAVVALMMTRHNDDADIAGSDLWWIALRGRLPAVDRPAWGLRPLPDTHAPEVRNGAVHE